MLEKPDIPDTLILSRLQEEYRLHAKELVFLPLGVDVNAAVYRLVTDQHQVYFLKLRKGYFDEMSVKIPQWLQSQGISHIMATIPTVKQQLWGQLEDYRMLLYPFVEGKDGYETTLSDRQWVELGATIKAIHSLRVPSDLQDQLRQETFSPQFREQVRQFQVQFVKDTFADPISANLTAFILEKKVEIERILARGNQLGQALQEGSPEFVLCHSDLHAGNLLIQNEQEFYIVDWDSPVRAPKECDLMFAGAGLSRNWPGEREAQLFYQGYGPAQVDPMALAYYRYERIVTDVAAFCEEILTSNEGEQDRRQALHYLSGNFAPGHLVEIAFASDHFS